ncbi:hypothetical protein [Paenibacillus woosongensis]|uniref:Uncharacterized protein n=1 Tax=Paenibacillus woosongensis TaxID=307580 RepID=A0A7X2Z5V3_9BACL|nr:hypothetical protein [Paenibacillus woosongensis]MUG47426.1 hypothetical protein [Paenibacillus woosongensis]
MESFAFMAFSTIEGLGIFALMMTIFKINPLPYVWQALFVILLMSLQSYLLRSELSLYYLAPITNIMLFIFFVATVVKEPLVGAAVITLTGYTAFSLLQTMIVSIVFDSIIESQSVQIYGYALQTSSAITIGLVSWLLYRLGIGFTWNFEKVRFKREDLIVSSTIFMVLIFFTIILYRNEIWSNLLFFSITLSFFLYYAVRKEKKDHDQYDG